MRNKTSKESEDKLLTGIENTPVREKNTSVEESQIKPTEPETETFDKPKHSDIQQVYIR